MSSEGETNLEILLKNMQATLSDDVFVFCSVQESYILPEALKPILFFREIEGVTLIIRKCEAMSFQIPYEFECRQITLMVHSSLEAVGFLAAISNKLASEMISINVISGYYHDHLFIKQEKVHQAMELLKSFSN